MSKVKNAAEVGAAFGPPNFGVSDEKAALLRNPTLEGAMKFWDNGRYGRPQSPDVALAGVHRARLYWKGSTPEMVQESKLWLLRRGYKIV